LSPNAISLIERGISSPTVSTLHRLAAALQVHITAFFEDHQENIQLILSRAGERPFSGHGLTLLESLGSGLEAQIIIPFVATLQPGADSGQPEMSHAGHELVYCLKGEVEYQVLGEAYRLSVGDALLFEARLPHRWRNPGASPARFLMVFGACQEHDSVEQHLQA
jgi:quercetin dioxygenase-like cupin family protein